MRDAAMSAARALTMNVAVIGGGWAGLAAAVELSRRNIPVTLFEASRVLGGRARAVEHNGLILDNGQHIMIGAYAETLRLLRQVGVDTRRHLLRLPLTLSYPPTLRLRAPRLPAPWHLLLALAGARGLSWRERLAAVRFIGNLRRRGFAVEHDCSVGALLDETRQPQALRRYLWEPLCVSALNTPAERASSRVFAAVLRDSLAADAGASDLILPRTDLTALFPAAAGTYIAAHGGELLIQTPIGALSPAPGGFVLDGDPRRRLYSHVIAAVAPYHLDALIGGIAQLGDLCATVAAFAYEPIVTCYLGYGALPALPEPMIGLDGCCTQWLFDRGRLNGQRGVLAAVISAHGSHTGMARGELAARVHAEIQTVLGPLPAPDWTQVITERRATFSCTPELARPAATTALANFLLCGDYVASDYPATLESAVRSGVRCARIIAGESQQ